MCTICHLFESVVLIMPISTKLSINTSHLGLILLFIYWSNYVLNYLVTPSSIYLLSYVTNYLIQLLVTQPLNYIVTYSVDQFCSSLSRQLVSWAYVANLLHISLARYTVATERWPMTGDNDESRVFSLIVHIFPQISVWSVSASTKHLSLTKLSLAVVWTEWLRRLDINTPKYSAEGNVPNLGGYRGDWSTVLLYLVSV
jgi:hypothetical protein